MVKNDLNELILKLKLCRSKPNAWNLLVLEIVPRLPQEQANTISKRKENEIGF